MRSEFGRITHEVNDMKLSIKGNADKGRAPFDDSLAPQSKPFSATSKRFYLHPKDAHSKESPVQLKIVKTHKVRPYLVANIIELLDLEDEQEEEEGAMKDVSLEV